MELRLAIVCVYKLYLLTYLLTYFKQEGAQRVHISAKYTIMLSRTRLRASGAQHRTAIGSA